MTRRLLLRSLPAFQAGLDAFTPLLGTWVGAGPFLGRPATARYRLESALNGRFILLRYEAMAEGKVIFEGHGYYKTGGAGTWQDSEGHIYGIAWNAAESGVATAWNDGAGSSRYERTGEELVVTDQMKGRTFATFRLKRA